MITIKKSKKKYEIKFKLNRARLSIPRYLRLQAELTAVLSELRKEAIKNDIRKFISER